MFTTIPAGLTVSWKAPGVEMLLPRLTVSVLNHIPQGERERKFGLGGFKSISVKPPS